MPTKKRRIGFIPRFDVLKVINKISEEEKLSNSKVVNILIEEALYARGLIEKIEKRYIPAIIKILSIILIIWKTYFIKMILNLTMIKKSLRNIKMIKKYIKDLFSFCILKK